LTRYGQQIAAPNQAAHLLFCWSSAAWSEVTTRAQHLEQNHGNPVDFSGWGDSERIAVNTATLYREFGSTGTPSDPATLFGWMAQIWNDRK